VDHQLLHLHRLHLVNGMDLKKLERHQYVVGNFRFQFRHLLDEVHLDVLQNLDEQNLVALLPFLDEVLRFLADVVVGVELHHQLRKDYFLDEVGVELHHLLRKDYFLDAVLREHLLQVLHFLMLLLSLLQWLRLWLHPVQPFQHREMPSTLQDRRRVRRQVQRQVQGLLLQSSLRQRSS
jgi:hypothetical protein